MGKSSSKVLPVCRSMTKEYLKPIIYVPVNYYQLFAIDWFKHDSSNNMKTFFWVWWCDAPTGSKFKKI